MERKQALKQRGTRCLLAITALGRKTGCHPRGGEGWCWSAVRDGNLEVGSGEHSTGLGASGREVLC